MSLNPSSDLDSRFESLIIGWGLLGGAGPILINSADFDGATEYYDGQIANDCHSCLQYEQSDVGDLRQSRE